VESETHHALHSQHAADLLLRVSALFQLFGFLEGGRVGVAVRVRVSGPDGGRVGVVAVVTDQAVVGTRSSVGAAVGPSPSQTGPV
jgi:hypothetical protein